MRQRLVLDQRHHRRDRDPVVGTERRPVRGQPLAVADERDAALRRVVRARRIALADDVQVPLEHHGRRALAAGASPGRGSRGSGRRPARARSPAGRPTRERARSRAPRAATGARSSSTSRSAPRTSAARVPSVRIPSSPSRRSSPARAGRTIADRVLAAERTRLRTDETSSIVGDRLLGNGRGSDAQLAGQVLLHQPAHLVGAVTVREDHELGEGGLERHVAP